MDKEEMNFVKTKKLKVTEPDLKHKGGNLKRTTIKEESFIDRNDGWKEDNAIWVKVNGEWRPWGSTYKIDLAELDPAFVAKYEEVQILPNDGSRPDTDNGTLVKSTAAQDKEKVTEANIQRMGDKIVEFPRGTVAPEYLWDAVCNNRFKVVKNYFESGKEPNKRYPRFGKMHSLIMGALRNGNKDMVELLQSYGETVLPEEQDEYDEIMKHINKNSYDESLKEEQFNELYDGKNYEYNGLSFTLWFDEPTNRYFIACDDIIEDKTDTPAYVGNLSSHKTDEDVMRLIKDRYDKLIRMIGNGLHKYEESLNESEDVKVSGANLHHTHDGSLKEDSVIYTLTIFPKNGEYGHGLLWHKADDAFDEIYFETPKEAKEYADKHFPDADSVVVRECDWWDDVYGIMRGSGPYIVREDGVWKKASARIADIDNSLIETKYRKRR